MVATLEAAPDPRAGALHILLAPNSAKHTRSAKSVGLALAFGAEVNARDHNGSTPLKSLVACRNPEIAEEELRIIDTLAHAGADLNLPDNTGATPLACAIQTAHFAATARLIALGAELNPVLPGDQNYVHMAARLGIDKADGPNILQALIVTGVDFDTGDDRGRTPLHIAVASGNIPATNVLLRSGADHRRKDNSGRLPADLVPCPAAGGCQTQLQELSAMLSRSPSVLPRFATVGAVTARAGTELEISGSARAGERLVVRTAHGDYSLVAGQTHRGRRQAKISPAGARRVVVKDKVYRKSS